MYKDREISYAEFISLLTSMHFIYEDKERILLPYIDDLRQTWDILLQSPKNIANHSILSSGNKITAICSAWRSSVNCWCIQNGVAYNIRDYVKTIVSESVKLLEEPSASFLQTWFRPNNTVVSKMCGYGTPLNKSDGVYSDINFCLLWDIQVKSGGTGDLTLLPPKVNSTMLENFIIDNRSSLLLEGEDISNDPFFESVNKLFHKAGLTHTRKIDVISSPSGIQAVILSYYSSLGINFSFLENRTEIIVGKNVTFSPDLIAIIGNTIYQNSKDRIVPSPIITDKRTGNALLNEGAVLLREYERRIWTKKAFEKLYFFITNKYL